MFFISSVTFIILTLLSILEAQVIEETQLRALSAQKGSQSLAIWKMDGFSIVHKLNLETYQSQAFHLGSSWATSISSLLPKGLYLCSKIIKQLQAETKHCIFLCPQKLQIHRCLKMESWNSTFDRGCTLKPRDLRLEDNSFLRAALVRCS